MPAAVRAFIVCSAVVTMACEIVYVDPEVRIFKQDSYVPRGDPTIEIGYYNEQLYTPFSSGSGCPIRFGTQGGVWVMFAVRSSGIAIEATIACEIILTSGELVGRVQETTTFVLATDGKVEVQTFPLPVVYQPVVDLYGREATFDCTVADADGRAADYMVRVVLEQG